MLDLSPVEINAVLLSLKVSIWAVGISLPLGIATALILARLEFPGKILLDSLIHVPLVVPPVVVGYLLLLLLGRNGYFGGWLYETFGLTVVFSWQGAAVAAAVMAFPLMVRAIRLSIETIDRRIEQAARTLGAGPLQVFLTITLPLSGTGIVVGIILAFARALGEFGATITFVSAVPGETTTLPISLYTLSQVPGEESGAIRLVVLSLIIAVGAMFAAELLARRVRKRISDA
ncbi:MAG: Molybdenum transport system permease protein ModB [Alphaproteobacteria bacterium MarineAlpha11_Bin1]|nr:MAG: Molybdenum transport system permease protein ModB [Alphaproteobacteria bacterium MarineAlpha11_Bin1]|tara:strand:+ start:2950 stop:3645 length:696 start_codon:yes stop_codon:yes gene_type:complete